ncbi:MAG TPA: YbhN family protein [Acidimicrobiales bacterium]|nr:YbhN family protein [Acidimicrobiales bacterium]
MARLARPVRRAIAILAVAAVVELFVLPQIAAARRASRSLFDVNPLLLALGLALEAAALLVYFQLTRSLIPAPERPSLLRTARIELSTLSLSHVVPGGSGVGGALGFRLLTEAGVKASNAGFALATQGLGSAAVLNLILWVSLVVSIPVRGTRPLYTTAAAVGVVVFGVLSGLILGLTRAEGQTATLLCRVAQRLPFLDGRQVESVVHRLAGRLRDLVCHPRLVARAVAWAAGNWLLDAASLWVFLAAFGHEISVDGLLIAYGLANVLGALPITPGGLGIIEGVLTPTLVGFGAPAHVAVLGVVSWRVVNFWLPIPVGGMAYLSLRLGPQERRGRRAEELARAVEEAQARAEPPRGWAARRGLGVPGGRLSGQRRGLSDDGPRSTTP